jgi:diguanylate cyclase (GGDEF)-like protein
MSASPILIVDDEPSNLATLKQILAPDYPLVFARNGEEGLSAAKKHQPGLILLDINMPDIDGYTVCRRLKADKATENIPVIFVSALSEVGDETAGFDCGGVDYITKPVSPALVQARVRTHLNLVHASQLERYVAELEIQQKKIRRLNRIQSVLSGINSAVIRLRDRQALLNETCRIAVDLGQFAMAWVGQVDPASATKQIVPLACAGMSAGMMQHIGAATDGEPLEGMGLCGEAIRTGQAAVCNDLRTHCHVELYDDPLLRDMQSAVALPILPGRDNCGVLVLYSRTAHFFDAEELHLLGELAGDISFALEHMEREAQLHYHACYDVLTGLPNSATFLDRLEQLIALTDPSQHSLAVWVLDLDRFSNLNDTLGRHVGDAVLKHVAACLKHAAPDSSCVGRIAGDTFAVAATGLPIGGSLAQTHHLLSALARPVCLHGIDLRLTAQAGISLYPADGKDAGSLFKNAEAALMSSRPSGGEWLYYQPEMNATAAMALSLEQELCTAVEQRQFVVCYQPKLNLRSGAIVGAEALIRWEHPRRGTLLPESFIAQAEESGLIVPIGEWVLDTVCAQLHTWQAAGCPVVPVAVNLSTVQMQRGDVCELIGQLLAKHGLDARYLELEVTESVVMRDADEVARLMYRLRGMGLKLALDDFGTGYSSLAYLKRLPFDLVKIDRSFVRDITTSQDDAAIAKAVIAMAHQLNLRVLAEGVETEGQLRYLRNHECDEIQGFLFSMAVPSAEFEAMLRARQRLVLADYAVSASQTLLLVDDDPKDLEIMSSDLSADGYRILKAGSGEEALELLARNPVQVILADDRMPGMSGAELFAVAKDLYPETVRILVSAAPDVTILTEAVNKGAAFKVLTKPWDYSLLREHVLDAFRRYRARA